MKANPTCNVCGVELTDENWYPSLRKGSHYICKSCENKKIKQWRKANPDKAKAIWTRSDRKEGHQSMSKNKECSSYLGVYVAERVLSQAFKNVRMMPMNNSGFDFICGSGYMIDVKSSCLHKNGAWMFTINHNHIANYFLCLAFDNREYLNPLYVWLIPGEKLNHLAGASIRPSTIHKWDEYQLDTAKVVTCCNMMKEKSEK